LIPQRNTEPVFWNILVNSVQFHHASSLKIAG